METQKITSRLNKSVEFAKENGEYNDEASWPYQQGVLLDYKEAEHICSLLDVVHRRELLLAAICEYNKYNTQKDIKAVDDWLKDWDSK